MNPEFLGKWLQAFFWLMAGLYLCFKIFRDLRGKQPNDFCSAQMAANKLRFEAAEKRLATFETTLTTALSTLGETLKERISESIGPVKTQQAEMKEAFGRLEDIQRNDVNGIYHRIEDQRTEFADNLKTRLDSFERTDRETQKTLMKIAVKVGAISGKNLED